ncbi:hypothetical protein KC992_00755 [Candidatus Saccharibacteria bacterium]|nr:hypothetical protein [Candidatus Saccharibacteria bacterium]MCA9328598.1 hypothetical protein [Candidatus Saccharibacteria bacterium]
MDNQEQKNNDYAFLVDPLQHVTPPANNRFNKKYLIIILAMVVAVMLTVLAIIASVVSNTNNAVNEDIQVQKITSSDAAPAIEKMQNLISAFSNQDYKTAVNLISPESQIYLSGVNQPTLNAYTGEGVQWSSCKQIQKDSYDTTEDISNSQTFQVIYIDYSCPYKGEDNNKRVTFDVRKNLSINNSDWKLYYIVVVEGANEQ